MMDPLLLKTSNHIKVLATPDSQIVLRELTPDKGKTAEEISNITGKPLLDICYAIENLEKYGFVKLTGGKSDSGILEKNYVLTATDYYIKRVVGDYEEVEMNVSSAKMIQSKEAKRGCSFCGTSVEKVSKLIAGQADANICDRCVIKCYNLI